jgi:competence protein ComEA
LSYLAFLFTTCGKNIKKYEAFSIQMKSVFKSYFYFNRGEKIGILLFIPIILILYAIPLYMDFIRKPEKTDFESYRKDILAFEASVQPDSIHKYRREFVPDFEHVDKSVTEEKLHPFIFDPNTISAQKLMALGLSEKKVKTILNYRNKGGRFHKKEDLQKIYGITDGEYEVLAPFVIIATESAKVYPVVTAGESRYPGYKKTIIELNDADSLDLLEIKGVGPAFAHRILRYRDKLGGFYAKEQLMEVYGMDSSRFAQIKDYCSINNSIIRKINLNDAGVADLKKHPYFDYYLAKSIVDYRIVHGPYRNVEQLRYTPLVYDAIYKRIEPYLKTE